ncbi:HPr kinase/phosphorylase [Occallatibacter riparius]|uniref:Aldolase n=1 Tax=Occallatibacter riparius TaxID=1002689 RepID=A0A9J7BHS9_9BACT|nr:aldolase [Occallatibacter riparius]UWZ82271.1 aldolase [Occallatibacter riparius]
MSTEQLKFAWLRGEQLETGDPTLARTPFSLSKTFYPLGFPVTVSTNCEEVLTCAEESWGSFTKLFDTEPVQINIGVASTDSLLCPPTPVCRVRDHLLTNIADGENFAISDHSLGYSLVWITTAALNHRDYFRYFFLESCAMGGISGRSATGIHGACVSLNGTGILLCGDSGAGKTTLSYACARAGFTYVTDDGSYLLHGRDDRLVVGNCCQVRFRPTAEALFPELRGRDLMERAGVGKPSVELSTFDIAQIATSNTAHVQRIVFLKRNVATQELAPFPTPVARMYMMQQILCMPFTAQNHSEAIDDLLRLGVYELRYNDLDWAVERLETLAREGC